MNNPRLDKTSYTIGDEVEIHLDFTSNEYLLDDVANINIDIFRVEKERNNFAFGFDYSLEEAEKIITIRKGLPDTFKEGLYLVSGIRLIQADDNGGAVTPLAIDDITKLFFWFTEEERPDLSELELTEKINRLNLERGGYVNASTITEAATGQSPVMSYRVLVFGVGCLIHSTQIMEGYTLNPLKTGYNYTHMLDAVNSYTKPKYQIELDNVESIERSFSSSTPLFVIDFQNVKAVNHSDASGHCSRQSENIFTVLAYDRGQRPNSFATVIIDAATGQSWQAFHFPGYSGNLVSDFNPASTAHTLENLLPKLSASSWIDLVMRIYADAESEANPCYACLKFWSILEMISKKEIMDDDIKLSHPNGDVILDHGGNAVKTKGALGKAYKYTLDCRVPPSVICGGQGSRKIIFETFTDAKTDPNYDSNTKVVTLWETLSAFYEIRNSTAHSGKFDIVAARRGGTRKQLAAELWELEHQTFLREVRGIMKVIVSKELNNA